MYYNNNNIAPGSPSHMIEFMGEFVGEFVMVSNAELSD